MWLLALILGLPLVEIALFVTVGAWLGLWMTLAIVVGTAIFGIWLIRRQGDRAQRDLKTAFQARHNPTRALASDVMMVVAGGLLVLPGFFTDTCGLLLLLPPVQNALVRFVQRRAKTAMAAHVHATAQAPASRMPPTRPRPDDVIDATWEEVPDDDGRPRSGWTRH